MRFPWHLLGFTSWMAPEWLLPPFLALLARCSAVPARWCAAPPQTAASFARRRIVRRLWDLRRYNLWSPNPWGKVGKGANMCKHGAASVISPLNMIGFASKIREKSKIGGFSAMGIAAKNRSATMIPNWHLHSLKRPLRLIQPDVEPKVSIYCCRCISICCELSPKPLICNFKPHSHHMANQFHSTSLLSSIEQLLLSGHSHSPLPTVTVHHLGTDRIGPHGPKASHSKIQSFKTCYPLVMTNIAMENYPWNRWFTY